MKITDDMVVDARVRDDEADVRLCAVEDVNTFHVPKPVMVYSASGARRMRLWSCEDHPLPDMITDDPARDEVDLTHGLDPLRFNSKERVREADTDTLLSVYGKAHMLVPERNGAARQRLKIVVALIATELGDRDIPLPENDR